MALNIKDPATEEMATELADRLGISKTAAIRHALQSQLALTEARSLNRLDAAIRVLETEIWPLTTGAAKITKADREEILGYDSQGING